MTRPAKSKPARREELPADPHAGRSNDAASRGSRTRRAITRLDPEAKVFERIFRDMMALDENEIESLLETSKTSSELKGVDQVALETGLITVDERDSAFGSYLARRVTELRGKLLGAQLGCYHILEEIQSGGMGIVFKARQESPMFTRDVALKFLLAGSPRRAEDRERFVSEVKGLANLKHPYLVPIYDSGIEEDLYYFSMEYVDGAPLSDLVEENSLTVDRRIEVARDIARALAYLHEKGVVHRDVKPGNIMVDRHGTTKLLDFGIAQFSADPRRRFIQAGTPHYMAPEVIQPTGSFGSIGPATDIYSLGAVLYRVLVGREVFADDNVAVVFQRTLRETPEFPRSKDERLPAELQRVVARCLRKSVDERYASAAQLADELDRYLKRNRWRTPLRAAAVITMTTALGLVYMLGTQDGEPTPPPPFDPSPHAVQISGVEAISPEAAKTLTTILEEATNDANERPRLLARFQRTLHSVWADLVQAAETESGTAHENYLKEYSLVAEPNALEELPEVLASAHKNQQEARRQEPSRQAYDLFKSSTSYFQQALEFVQRRRQFEGEQRHQQQQREIAVFSREQAMKEAPSPEDEAQLHYSATAKRAAIEARRQLIAGNEAFGGGEYTEADVAFAAAQRAFAEAKRVGRDHYQELKLALRDDVDAAARELRAAQSVFARTVATAELPSLQSSLTAIRETLEAAARETDAIPRAREQLTGMRAQLRAAVERSVALKQTAERWRRRAAEVAAVFAEHRAVPAALDEDCGAVLEVSRRAVAHWRRREYAEAASDYESVATQISRIEAEYARLTQDMVWVDGHVNGRPRSLWVDRLEVSVGVYAEFLDAEDRLLRTPHDWQRQRRHAERPVVGVSLADAVAFATRVGKRLPVRPEWELLTRDRDGRPRRFPFGDRFAAAQVNALGGADGHDGLAPADSFADGASAWGCLHLAGNASEWAIAAKGDGAEAYLMGGSFLCGEPEHLRSTAAFAVKQPNASDKARFEVAGFRCVLDAGQFAPQSVRDLFQGLR